MSYTFKELKKKNLTQLKAIAKNVEHEAVQGYTQMHKDHLLEALCHALNIDMHEHHEVVGINKAEIKQKIRALKQARDQAEEKKDRKAMVKARQEIKALKHRLRSATV